MDNKSNPTVAPCCYVSHAVTARRLVTLFLPGGVWNQLAAMRDLMSLVLAHYGAKSDDGVCGGERCYRGRMRGMLIKSHGEAKNRHQWEWGRNVVICNLLSELPNKSSMRGSIL